MYSVTLQLDVKDITTQSRMVPYLKISILCSLFLCLICSINVSSKVETGIKYYEIGPTMSSIISDYDDIEFIPSIKQELISSSRFVISTPEPELPQVNLKELRLDTNTKKENSFRYDATKKEIKILEKITEAEVTGGKGKYNNMTDEQFLKCKIRIVQVILNRIESKKYPNTVKEVVFQPYQFSPVDDGRYDSVKVTKLTKKAVRLALKKSTKDYTQNAIYFAMDYVDFPYGKYMFTDKEGHSFYKK